MNMISIVVPCFNEEKAIEIFYDELKKAISNMNTRFEILFVDDGSTDRTCEKIERLSELDDSVCYISFSRNFGKEAAIYAGMEHASGDYIVLMDVDLQDPPHLIPEMYTIIKTEGYDCVATRRSNRAHEPVIRSMFAHNFYKIFRKMTGLDIVDGARDFRMMSRSVVDSILHMPEHNRFSKGIFSWIGYKTKWLEYENIERAAGTTKWSFFKLLVYALGGFTSFSYVPLYMPLIAGVFMIATASVMGIILVVCLFMQLHIQTHYWIICVILLMSASILISVGILGMYLARIDCESKARPQYIIQRSNIRINNFTGDVCYAKR